MVLPEQFPGLMPLGVCFSSGGCLGARRALALNPYSATQRTRDEKSSLGHRLGNATAALYGGCYLALVKPTAGRGYLRMLTGPHAPFKQDRGTNTIDYAAGI